MIKPKLAIIKRGGATVFASVEESQALLPAVPEGKSRIVTEIKIENPSAPFSGIGADLQIGFQGGDVAIISAASLEDLDSNEVLNVNVTSSVVGVADDILTCTFLDTSINATVDIEVFFYDIND